MSSDIVRQLSWRVAAGQDVMGAYSPVTRPTTSISIFTGDGPCFAAGCARISAQRAWPEKTVEGFVIHLDRLPEQGEGVATLRVLIDGRPRRLRARFEAGEYSKVVRAHDEKLPVSLEGDIYPSGQRWELRNPRNRHLMTDFLDTDDQVIE